MSKKPDFKWITSRSATAYVSIDRQNRIYIARATRDMLDLPNGEFYLLTGYDFANKRIVLAKPEIVRVPNVEPFKFDKRSYCRARYFVEQAQLEGELPVRFIYAGKDFSEFPRGAHIFTLEGHESDDV